MTTISIIPARGGSKGVPKKNIKTLKGFPLIAYSIVASLMTKKVDRTIVSTNSPEIADIANYYGAEVPFMRPDELSQDNSIDLEFMQHAIIWLYENGGGVPDFLVHLRPTTPYRTPDQIEEAINTIISKKEATSLRSVHSVKETPFKHFTLDNGYLQGVKKHNALDMPNCEEYYNLPRQMFPQMYIPSGSVDIVIPETVITGSMHGDKIASIIVPDPGEIDTEEDYDYIEWRIEKYGSIVYDYLKENFK